MNEFHATDKVGGYRLEARLGGGGFGTVWRARRISDSRLVALKLISDASAADDMRLRADVEVLAASAAANSPHVVRVLDGGFDPLPYVVMEYINGTTLAEELQQRKQLAPQEVIEIGLSIADALQALNQAGIVHRDVKPSNVMIDRAGVLKLTDFGIAKIAGFDAVTLTGQLPLSIAYAAPEVWEGRAEHRSDLYAFGILLYQCLTGLLPFRGAYAELFYQHRSKEPDFSVLPADTPPSLVTLIETCMAKAPADRPRNASVCALMLQQAQDESASTTSYQEPALREPERFGPWLRKQPVAGRSWAWQVRHETSDQQAVLEMHFEDSIEYGEGLRRAVMANERLVPLGAQRIFQTSRLILRPGEAWQQQPPPGFQFWVVLEDRDTSTPPKQVTPRMALRAVEGFIALIDAAEEEEIPLNLEPGQLSLLPDGSIYLRHPGFPRPGQAEPERQALTYLKSLPLTRDVKPGINRATSLEDARRGLATMNSLRELRITSDFEPAVVEEDEPAVSRAGPDGRVWALGLAAIVIAVVITTVAYLVLRDNTSSSPALPPPEAQATLVPTPPPNPDLAVCMALGLPAPISGAEAACGNGVAGFVFDASCPRGQACNRKDSPAGPSLGVNDRAVAFIDPSGNLALAREDGSEPMVLTNSGKVQQPAWSPDGRYLAYLLALPVDGPPALTPQAGVPSVAPTVAPPSQLYVTQLHIIEADRPANDGVLFASGAAAGAPTWLQRYASWPQWSADGNSLYFLSQPITQPGAQIMSVEVPRQGDNVDFSRLRSALPTTETLVATRLSTLALNASDFGQPQGYLGRFVVRPGGEIVTQVCMGDRVKPSCGLGRWDGHSSTLVPIMAGRVVDPPADGPDASYAAAVGPNGAAVVLKIVANKPSDTNAKLMPPGPTPEGAWFASKNLVAVSRRGDALLMPLSGSQLGGVSLADGTFQPWRDGSSPVWFQVSTNPPPNVQPPISQPFSTPTPDPSPTVTPSPTPRPTPRTMTLNLTARRAGSVLPGATVIALVGAEECQRGMTDSLGRLSLVFPRDPAPAACTQTNAQIRFQVNGTIVPETSRYDPQSSQVYDLTLP